MNKLSVSLVALFLVLSGFTQADAWLWGLVKGGKDAAPYVEKYGPEAVNAGKKYGTTAVNAGKKYGPEAVDAAKKYGGKAVDAAKDSGQGVAGWLSDGASSAVVKGKEIYKRNETFNPRAKDAVGMTNIQRMQQGKAPIGKDGNPVQIHHDNQSGSGPLFEVTAKEHKAIPVDRTKGVGLSPDERKEFNSWRPEYWKQRAQDMWGGKK